MKSKMNIKNILILAVISVITLFFINNSFAANTAKVSVETAKLRDEANVDSKVLELISLNEEVEILEKTGDWYKVKYKNIIGYLRKDLLLLNEEKQEENKEQVQVSEEVKENVVNNNEVKKDLFGKQKVAEDTKLKIVPLINATETIEVKADTEVMVTEIINGWLCIETQNTKGWIRQEKIKVEDEKNEDEENKTAEENTEVETQPEEIKQPEVVVEEPKKEESKTMYVNSNSVNLREQPNTSSKVIDTLTVNTTVTVLSEENGWSKVKINNKEAYISSSLLSAQKQETSRSSDAQRANTTVAAQPNTTTSTPATTSNVGTSKIGANVVETANQYLGCSYVYGGSTPSGFDCSGFTSYVYKAHGVTLNRTAAGQYSNGVEVDKSNLQPGDLVMFGKSGINHVGIYIGGGNIIHAANPSRGVTTDTINSGYYYNNYVGARRVM